MSRGTMALASMFAASLPAVAAASGGDAGPGTNFYVYLVDFLVLMIPVAWLVIPRARKALAARHDAVKAELDEASARFAEAEERMRQAELRLTNLKIEIDALLAEFRRQGQAEHDALALEGESLAAKIRVDSEFRLDQAVKVARAELAGIVVSRAFAQVEDRLSGRGSASLSDGVVDRVVREVGVRPS